MTVPPQIRGGDPTGQVSRATPNWRAERYTRLLGLGFASYREYLESGHWQDTRRRYWASDQPHDCICGETEGLQLHHMTYQRIGREALTDLTPLCGRCHSMIHALVERGELGLDFAGFVNAKRAERYAEEGLAPDRFAVQRMADPGAARLLDAMGRLEDAIEAHPWAARRLRGPVFTLRGRMNAIRRKLDLLGYG